jgi:uncharacterized protein YciI
MKYTTSILALTLTLGCIPKEPPVPAGDPIPRIHEQLDGVYDEALATSLGADEYGMRPYVIAYLKAGPNQDQTEEEATKLGQAHMANIRRLGDEGKRVLAGPFLDEGEVRGLYVFAVSSIEEAKALTETDPAVQAGRLTLELHPWYGSAALVLVNGLHKKLEGGALPDINEQEGAP